MPCARRKSLRRPASAPRSISGAAARSPYEDAIAQTRKLGVRNMNGGDSRYDPDYPSISYLSPVSRPVGAERQIYAGNANDYLYITDGTGREHGYLNLDATIKATEGPRRLKPMNVYYHMFAGERAAQLAAVKHHLDAARAALVTPIAASNYAAIADGFLSAEITALDKNSWLIRHRGALGTVRFDDAARITVDFARSVGVLGAAAQGRHRSTSRLMRRRPTCCSRSSRHRRPQRVPPSRISSMAGGSSAICAGPPAGSRLRPRATGPAR